MTPTQRRTYLTGALAARDYLCRTQADLRIHRELRPDTLRLALAHTSVSMVLEGCQINPETWEVLTAIERAGESQ